MPSILVVSDDSAMANSITHHFTASQWTVVRTDTRTLVAQGSVAVTDHACLIMVIDEGFRARFGELVQEITNLIRNCAAKTPLHLIVAGTAYPHLAPWVACARQTFCDCSEAQRLRDALQEIERMEGGSVPASAFVSPMQLD